MRKIPVIADGRIVRYIEPQKNRVSFLKRHEGTILEVLFAAYLAYLFLQYFTN